MFRERFECLAFAFLSALAVRNVQERELVVLLVSDCGRNAGVHTARDETDGELWSIVVDGGGFQFFSLDFL